DRDSFAVMWSREVAQVPAYSEGTLYIVAGLLLPVWKRLPQDSTRVYRLQTDDGERIIGRRVSPAWAASVATTESVSLTANEAYAALIDGRTILDLAEGLQLRRVRVMGAHRIELTGFSDAMRERLRAYGLFSEIISWKLRFFVPVGAAGSGIIGRLVERFPIERIAARRAARPPVFTPTSWSSLSACGPSRFVVTTSRMAIIRAITGRSSTSAMARDARCSCGC